MWVDLHSWDCGPQTLDHASEERKTHWFLMIWTCFKRVKKFVYQRAKKLNLDSRQMVAKARKHFMPTSGFSYDFSDGAQRHIARSSSTMGEAKRLFRREKKNEKKDAAEEFLISLLARRGCPSLSRCLKVPSPADGSRWHKYLNYCKVTWNLWSGRMWTQVYQHNHEKKKHTLRT